MKIPGSYKLAAKRLDKAQLHVIAKRKTLLNELGKWCEVYSQKAVAAKCGVHATFIADILKGNKSISDRVKGIGL